MTPVRNLLATCATWGFLVLSRAEASDELVHDIAAQSLARALSELAAQTGLQVVYVSEIAATRVSKGAPRGLPAEDALRRLLAGTGLRFEFLNARTVRIFADASCASMPDCAGPLLGRTAVRAPAHTYGPPAPHGPLEEVIVNG